MNEVIADQSKLEKCFAHNPHFADKKWLCDFRYRQWQEFMARGFPTCSDEKWKYTEIKENRVPNHSGRLVQLQSIAKHVFSEDMQSIRVVFVNGHFAENLSNMAALPMGVTLSSVQQALAQQEDVIKPYLTQIFDKQRFPFAVLNSALMTDGIFLQIPENVKLSTPIHLLFMNTQQNDFMINPRNIIVANKNSQVTFIEDHVGEAAQHYFTNAVTDIYTKDNACVEYYKIQDEDSAATHVASLFVNQQQDSQIKTYFLARGCQLAREDVQIKQVASGAKSYLHGFYCLSKNGQHVDHHVQVDHLAAHGDSVMLYRGILANKSRAVFNGKVYVDQAAKQINAHQANHNLLLSPDAEVNTKPELEIYADDVKCTHGATVGQLDSEALFYLRSRGIETEDALKILTHAFVEEIFNQINDTTIRQYLRKRMSVQDEL